MREQDARALLTRVLGELDAGREVAAKYARKLCVGGSVIAVTITTSGCPKDKPAEPTDGLEPTATATSTVTDAAPEYMAVQPPPDDSAMVPEPVTEYAVVEPPLDDNEPTVTPPNLPYMAPFV